jgi:putative transposase
MSENSKIIYDTDLTDEQYELIRPLLERKGKVGRPTRLDLRPIVNALLYMGRTGCQWRMLPKEYPKWQTVRYYFDKWTEEGLWLEINQALVAQVRQKKGAKAPLCSSF